MELPEIKSPMWSLFGSNFLKISVCLHEIDMLFHCLFKALCLFCFLCVFEQAETVKSIKNTAQAIKNRGCRKSTTNRSRARFGMDLGVILGASLVTNVCFC